MTHSEKDREKFHGASMAKDVYFVAVKLLLRDGDKLLITHDVFGNWDIPGGRIRSDQFEASLEDVLEGKVREEIGDDMRYELGDIKATFRVERVEVRKVDEKVRVFAVGFEAQYIDGDIKLGDIHDAYEWIDLRTVNLADYASPSGWVEQLEEYRKEVKF